MLIRTFALLAAGAASVDVAVTHALFAVIPEATAPGAGGWSTTRPRALAEPRLEAWAARRLGSPADIAQAVKFLIFDAPYVTGQVINVDGGRSAHL